MNWCNKKPDRPGWWKRRGKKLRKYTVTKTPYERFMQYVVKTDTCWNWIGHRCPGKYGYGRFWDGHRMIPAHWFLLEEYPHKGIFACHHCDNPACVRPDHIFLGSQADNMNDMYSKGRNPRARISEDQAILAKACPHRMGALVTMARSMQLDVSILYNIRCGFSWRHLPPSTDEDRNRAESFLAAIQQPIEEPGDREPMSAHEEIRRDRDEWDERRTD